MALTKTANLRICFHPHQHTNHIAPSVFGGLLSNHNRGDKVERDGRRRSTLTTTVKQA